MSDLSKIRDALQDRVVNVVAENSGVNRVTVGDIKSGKQTTASERTIRLLSEYLGVSGVSND